MPATSPQTDKVEAAKRAVAVVVRQNARVLSESPEWQEAFAHLAARLDPAGECSPVSLTGSEVELLRETAVRMMDGYELGRMVASEDAESGKYLDRMREGIAGFDVLGGLAGSNEPLAIEAGWVGALLPLIRHGQDWEQDVAEDCKRLDEPEEREAAEERLQVYTGILNRVGEES